MTFDVMALDILDWSLSSVVTATIATYLTGLAFYWSWSAKRTRANRTNYKLPPGPRGLPVLGSLLALGEFPHRSFYELSKRYGPIMFMRLGSKPAVVICNNEMAKEVLQANDQVFASRPPLLLPSVLFYDNMDIGFAPYSSHWRQARKICNFELFTASRLSHFSGVIEAEIMATIQSILQTSDLGKAVNLTELFSGLAMNIVTKMMWGKRHRNIDGENQSKTDNFGELISTSVALSGANNIADFLPFLQSLTMKLTGLERKANNALKGLDDFFEHIISEREQVSNKTEKVTDNDDFVDVLLKLGDQSSEASDRLSRKAMKGIMMDMLIAGTDTTGVTLEWALAELLRQPDLIKKAQDELNSVVGSRRLVTPADIPNLKYVKSIIKETLRTHSAGPMGIPHLSLSDCKVGGYDVPANTITFVNFFAVHHDPAVWDKPFEFNPERFLESSLDYRGRHFELLPFSSGRRMCPGLNLATAVLHLGVAQMLHTMNLSLPAGQTPESVDMTENSGLVLSRANPLFVLGKPRLSQGIISPK